MKGPPPEVIWNEAQPVYEEMSGWETSTAGVRTLRDLPAKARQYLDRLSELVGVPFSLISTGAVRDDTILCEDSPLTRWFPALRSALL